MYSCLVHHSSPRVARTLHIVRSAYVHVVHEIREKFVMSFKWKRGSRIVTESPISHSCIASLAAAVFFFPLLSYSSQSSV